jgi:hypothetical protein
MIKFYNDNLVPPELCRLLYALVPKRHHVPVRFHNYRRKDVHGERGRYSRGAVGTNWRWTKPSHIDINLNPIFGVSLYRHYTATSVPSSFVWRDLLEVCLHEFGHVATWDTVLHMNHYEYVAEYGRGRVYKATERLADEWKERYLERILAWDPRLAQPEVITGYLGARLIEHRELGKEKGWGRYYWAWVKDVRCLKTGGQLTAGNVLRELGIYPYRYTNAYEVLKRASEGLGIDYVDGAGRHHKLYTWGDVPLVAERLERAALRKRHRRCSESKR